MKSIISKKGGTFMKKLTEIVAIFTTFLSFIIFPSSVSAHERTYSYSYVPNSYKGIWYQYNLEAPGHYSILHISSHRAIIKFHGGPFYQFFKPKCKVMGQSGVTFLEKMGMGGSTYKIEKIKRKGKLRKALVEVDSGYNCTFWYKYKLKDKFVGPANDKYGRKILW